MQQHSNMTGVSVEASPGTFTSAAADIDTAVINPMTLARLDMGLLECLRKLGTSRQRICSALCLSYAEYDEIVELLRVTR